MKTLLRFIALGALFALAGDFFFNFRFFFQPEPVALGWVSITFLILLPAAVSYPYLRNFKLVLYRVALRNLLHPESKLYLILSKGLLIKFLAVLYALGIGVSLFVFMATMRAAPEKLVCVVFSACLFILVYKKNDAGIFPKLLASDISTTLQQLALPMIFAWFTAALIIAVELNLALLPQSLSAALNYYPGAVQLHNVFAEASAIVGENEIAPRLVRIMIRHIYLQDLVVKSLADAEFGKIPFAFLLFVKESFTYLAGIFFFLKSACNAVDLLYQKLERE